jgi:hypothetical protein
MPCRQSAGRWILRVQEVETTGGNRQPLDSGRPEPEAVRAAALAAVESFLVDTEVNAERLGAGDWFVVLAGERKLGIGEFEDRADHPVDLLRGDRPQRDLADQEQVAGLVEGEAEHVAGRLAQQQVAVEPLALLLGRPHEERLHPQGPVADGQVDADAELALAGQA